MKKLPLLCFACTLAIISIANTSFLCHAKPENQNQYLKITADDYLSRMKAGWIGQMAGVGWGAPTEFLHNGEIVPAEEMPEWKPEYINQFWQDDLYVEMTFLKSLEDHGWDVTHKEAGIDFGLSRYPLWHANRTGRRNLRAGIAPPDSGHPQFNEHADDIDYQIESDYSGLIAPGIPQVPITLGELFGRLMNYGDGVYGGQFIGGMYSAAFFESDPEKIVRAGLECIPVESEYSKCIHDVLAWHQANPENWEVTWQLIEEKYNEDHEHRKASCGGKRKNFNIDAKINGAYVVMGLLYGERDPDKTIEIATRCGQDSDCNPSSAAGILFTTLGMGQVPDKFTSDLDQESVFIHTPYTFPKLIEVCSLLARDAIVRAGGKITRDEQGREIFLIPRKKALPSPLEQSWEPGQIANSRYTDAEIETYFRSQDLSEGRTDMNKILADFAPGWQIEGCGLEMDPGMRDEYRGRKNILITHPDDSATPCILSRELELPADSKSKLQLAVSHAKHGDWILLIRIDGKEVENTLVSKQTVDKTGWLTREIDLSPYAGKTIKLELVNQPNDWFYEAAYWDELRLINP
ncbi:MAG: ADP-ribosylglycohydrolase family protein [Planctomycetaceae bacterium]|nr:ADP-ribosylglycohydrolase family protein [Planctomycetaceae bacterium]